MTGRCPDMEHGSSAAAQLPRSRRTLLVLLSLLCAAGLMSAAVSRAVDPGQRHRAPAVASVAKIADGHGTSPRAVPQLLADTTTSAVEPLERGVAVATVTTRAAGEPAATVRTRGPPGRA